VTDPEHGPHSPGEPEPAGRSDPAVADVSTAGDAGGDVDPIECLGADDGPEPRVDGLFVAPEAGAPMESRDRVELASGGVVGDRYAAGGGHFALDGCPVTLVAGEALDAVRVEHGLDLGAGEHRRNVVVRGVAVDDLVGATVRLGTATVRGTRPRPPCAHLEELVGAEGVAAALRERGGVCADVVDPGAVAVGDPIEPVEANPRTEGARIAERLRRRSDE